MQESGRRVPSPSLVISVLALLVAMSGTAVAVSRNSVGPTELQRDAVHSRHVEKDAIGRKALAREAIASRHVKDEKLKSHDLKDGEAVSGADVIDGSLGRLDLGPNSVDSDNVADDSLTGRDIDESTLEGLSGGGPPSGPAAGDLSGSYPDPLVAPGAIDTTELADDAVASAKLDDLAVTTAKVAANAIGTGKLADDAVSGAKIAPEAVDTTELATGAVTGPKLAADAVGSDAVADDSLTGDDVVETSFGKVGDADTLDGADSSDFLGTGDGAGGDLSGPFSNLEIGSGAVGAPEIASNAVGIDELDTTFRATITLNSPESIDAGSCEPITTNFYSSAEPWDLAHVFMDPDNFDPAFIVMPTIQRTAGNLRLIFCNIGTVARDPDEMQLDVYVLDG